MKIIDRIKQSYEWRRDQYISKRKFKDITISPSDVKDYLFCFLENSAMS